jgi:hypothetical protein
MAVEEGRHVLGPRGVAPDQLQPGLRRQGMIVAHQGGNLMSPGDRLVDHMVPGATAAADDIEPPGEITVRLAAGFPV